VLSALLAASSKQAVPETSSSSSPPAATTPAAAETVVQPVAASLPSYQQPSTDASQPAKKSFLRVIDHQNQPADRSAGDVSESTSYGWQERPDLMAQSRVGDLDYRIPASSTDHLRVHPVEDTRRVVHREVADLQQRLDSVRSDGYGGRSDTGGRSYWSSGAMGDRSRYYGGSRDRSEFWNELSAYCDEYEARMGRREDFGAVVSRLPRPPPANYPDDFEQRRAAESSMYDRRSDVGDAARQYAAKDMDERERLMRYHRL